MVSLFVSRARLRALASLGAMAEMILVFFSLPTSPDHRGVFLVAFSRLIRAQQTSAAQMP